MARRCRGDWRRIPSATHHHPRATQHSFSTDGTNGNSRGLAGVSKETAQESRELRIIEFPLVLASVWLGPPAGAYLQAAGRGGVVLKGAKKADRVAPSAWEGWQVWARMKTTLHQG
jgi:hypothetical protein